MTLFWQRIDMELYSTNAVKVRDLVVIECYIHWYAYHKKITAQNRWGSAWPKELQWKYHKAYLVLHAITILYSAPVIKYNESEAISYNY